MILENDDLKSLLRAVRTIYNKSYQGRKSALTRFALDIGVSISTMSLIINYHQYRPGQQVQDKLRNFVKKLRQRRPAEVNQK